jgi:hypothetical protein
MKKGNHFLDFSKTGFLCLKFANVLQSLITSIRV